MRGKLIPFVLGVVVAVVFYEATGIRLQTTGGEHVAARSSASLAGSNESSSRAVKLTTPSAPRPSTTDSERAAQLQADLTDARARAEFSERQLEAIEGQAVPWPDHVAPAFTRESVEQQLKEYVVDRGLGQIKSLECSEYPCVGVVQLTDSSPQGPQALRAALGEMMRRHHQGRVSLSIQSTRVENGSNAASYAGVAIAPDDVEVRSRTRHRARLELEGYGR